MLYALVMELNYRTPSESEQEEDASDLIGHLSRVAAWAFSDSPWSSSSLIHVAAGTMIPDCSEFTWWFSSSKYEPIHML